MQNQNKTRWFERVTCWTRRPWWRSRRRQRILPTDELHIAYIDGAARPHGRIPGPASYSVVLYRADGRLRASFSAAIGQATNNAAEYCALLAALEYARGQAMRRLRVRTDSELVVRQMKGLYRVKQPSLCLLHGRALYLAGFLDHFEIEHVPRLLNQKADALASAALDRSNAHQAA